MDGAYLTAMRRELTAWVDSLDHHPVVGPVIRGDASRDGYVRFLWSTYHYLRWSGPLLAGAADAASTTWECTIDDADDQAAIALSAAKLRTFYPRFFASAGSTGVDACHFREGTASCHQSAV